MCAHAFLIASVYKRHDISLYTAAAAETANVRAHWYACFVRVRTHCIASEPHCSCLGAAERHILFCETVTVVKTWAAEEYNRTADKPWAAMTDHDKVSYSAVVVWRKAALTSIHPTAACR